MSTSERRQGKEADLLLSQLHKAVNFVGSTVAFLATTGDSTSHLVWESNVMPKNSVVDVTVEGRSCLADFTDSGRFRLDRSFVRATGAVSQTRDSDMPQPIGAEVITVDISADNRIQVNATDAGVATEFTVWVECR